MVVFLSLVLVLGLSLRIAVSGQSDRTAALFEEAVAAINAARYSEAQEKLDRIIRNDPGFYKAYPKRWAVLGKLREVETIKIEIRKDVELLEQVPPRKRNDDLYFALMEACDWLADAACRETWRREAISRLPRGRVEQATRLDAAWKEKDPAKSVAHFEGILRDFPDDVTMLANAVRGRFEVMSDHPDQFANADLVEAAVHLERVVAVRPVPDENPHEYVRAMLQISKTLAERSPARALECAARGVGFVDRVWPTTDDVRLDERYHFWPAMIRAYGATGDWKAARKVCDALIETVDAARISISVLLALNEAAVRSECGRVLEKTDSLDEARLQLSLAAAIDQRFKEDTVAFSGRHPLAVAQTTKFEAALVIAESRVRGRRDGQVKAELLATAERRPAPEFVLKGLDGRTVSLNDFRGRALVLSFWATWCGPCIGEMRELETVYRKHRRNSRVAFAGVSIDADTDKVPGFVKVHGITLPMLLSNGDVERSYHVDGVPILYVIDATGKIRFLRDGWKDDGYGLKRIDWMIEVALR
jgi:peroxiredoxin